MRKPVSLHMDAIVHYTISPMTLFSVQVKDMIMSNQKIIHVAIL